MDPTTGHVAAPADPGPGAEGNGGPVEIVVLYVRDCPHVGAVRSRLEDAARLAGVRTFVRVQEVTSADAAARLGMRGSPSVLVDGRHVLDGEGEPSLACRLTLPTVEQLAAALAR